MIREDTQPNEVRHSRKGMSVIPAIRPTRPRSPPQVQPNYRTGTASGRYYPYPPSQLAGVQRRQGPSRASALTGNNSASSSSMPTGFERRQTSFTTQHGSSKRRLPEVGPPQLRAPRYEDPKDLGRNMSSNREINLPVESTVFELPASCRKGAPNRKANRQRWVKDHISQLEADPGVKVISHAFISEDQIRFEYRANRDKKPRGPFVNLPAGNGGSDLQMSIPATPRQDLATQLQRSTPSLAKLGNLQPVTRGLSVVLKQESPEPESNIGGAGQMTSCEVPSSIKNQSRTLLVAPDGHHGHEEAPPKLNFARALRPTHQNVSEGRTGQHHEQGCETILLAYEAVATSAERPNGNERAAISTHPGASTMFTPAQIRPHFRGTPSGVRAHLQSSNPRIASHYTPAQAGHLRQHSSRAAQVDDVTPMPQASPLCPLAVRFPTFTGEVAGSSSTAIAKTKEALLPPDASRSVSEGNASASGNTAPRLAPVGEPCCIAKAPYDKPRALLSGYTEGLLSISVRGSVYLWSGRDRSCQPRALVTVMKEQNTLLDDACLLSSDDEQYLVLAHARDSRPLSLIHLEGEQTGKTLSFDRASVSAKHGGVSAVAPMMQSGLLATGGYDHLIHLWTVTRDAARTSWQLLNIKHTSVVQSLLSIRDTSHKLVTAGADCTVNLWDFSSERVVNTLKASNSVYHIHGLHHSYSPFCTLWEVAHRDLQHEIRDHRLVPTDPVQRFGYETSKLHGRYAKGELISSTFISGDWDGFVRLWDLRKLDQPYEKVSCIPGHRILRVSYIPSSKEVAVCSEDYQVQFMNYP